MTTARTKPIVDTAPFPHNLDAERSVLGAILLDDTAITTATARLRPDDFFLSQHRHILKAMVALDVNGVAIDTITLMEHLDKNGELDAAGGVAYLSQLPDGLPRVTNVQHYARIVKEKAKLRSLIYSASAMQEQAFAGGDDADVILDRASKALVDLRDSSATSNELFVQRRNSAKHGHFARSLRTSSARTFATLWAGSRALARL